MSESVKVFVVGASVQSGTNEEGDDWSKITFETLGLEHGLSRTTCFAKDGESLLKGLTDKGVNVIEVSKDAVTYDPFTGNDGEEHKGAKIGPAVLLNAIYC